MKKFIKGTLYLDENVTDLEVYEKDKMETLNKIINWATDNKVEVCFGTSDDNTYLCQYAIVDDTLKHCRGDLSELKAMLKPEFPKIKCLLQCSGVRLY